MLLLFVVALVGSAVALPQVLLSPGSIQQQLQYLPAGTAQSSIRALPPSNAHSLAPAQRAAIPTIAHAVNFAPAAAHLRPLLHDASMLSSVAPVVPALAPLRTHAVSALAPSAPALASPVPALNPANLAFAPAGQFAPAAAPLRPRFDDSSLLSSAVPHDIALAPFRSAIPANHIIAPAANNAPAIAPFRTLINDASSAARAPAVAHPAITTLQRVHLADESGQFTSSHTDSAGTTVQESGHLVSTNDGRGSVLVKSGSFSYTSPDGTPVSVSYTADARGFHPINNLAPVAPQPTF